MPRFPQTAALIAQEGEAILDAILEHEDFHALLERKLEDRYMASVQDLKGALDSAKASFDDLVGKVGQSQGGIDPSDLDPILSEIKDLQGKIDDVKASLPSKAEGSTGDASVQTANLSGIAGAGQTSGDANVQTASTSGASGSLTP